ncbi:MAG: tetratricopeptide repeat protein [Anaerolineae bacterium]|nr:tetratricopeptide repeat protein [Anaerolineae bacterium]
MAHQRSFRIAHEALTARELGILRLLANGYSDSAIAEAMVLTLGTVKWYNRQIYGKLGVRNRAEAAVIAERQGLLGDGAPAPEGSKAGASSESIPHNLPASLNTFIGRESERETLSRLLGVTRLLTLTGAPGAGKTRLALEVGQQVLPRFSDGVFFVSLASIADAALVPSSVARTLGLIEYGIDTLSDLLKRHLRTRSTLLILDNFEHVLAAAPWLAELLADAPQLRVLATSREALGLYGEHEYPVPALDLPDLRNASLDNVRRSAAVELYVQRAQAAAPAFVLSDDNAASVAAICVHLDGLPLAIELAAARAKFYAPQTLLVRLGSRLDALGSGPRDLPARQRTLRSTLAWSYDLLDGPERALFAQIGVFAGGFTPDAVEAVCGGMDGSPLDTYHGLESLLNKNLIRLLPSSAGQPEPQRFAMLETMREYALERLAESGTTALVRARHARYFLDMAEHVAQLHSQPGAEALLAQMESEHDNLRAALAWCIESGETGDGDMGLRLVASLSRFWEVRGYLAEGRRWFDAVENASAQPCSATRALALAGIGDLAYLQCDYTSSQALYEAAIAIFKALRDEQSAARVLISLGEVATEIGDYEAAFARFESAYATLRQGGDRLDNARALTQLGYGALRAGDLDQAQVWLDEGCALYRSEGQHIGVALAMSGLGEIAIRRRDLPGARRFLGEALALRRQLGHKWGIAVALGSLAWAALLGGDEDHALQLLRESLALRRELGDPGGIAWCLEKLAEMAWSHGRAAHAARILGAAQEIRARVRSVIDPSDRTHYDTLVRAVSEALALDLFTALHAEGASMSVEQAIAFALDSAASGRKESRSR